MHPSLSGTLLSSLGAPSPRSSPSFLACRPPAPLPLSLLGPLPRCAVTGGPWFGAAAHFLADVRGSDYFAFQLSLSFLPLPPLFQNNFKFIGKLWELYREIPYAFTLIHQFLIFCYIYFIYPPPYLHYIFPESFESRLHTSCVIGSSPRVLVYFLGTRLFFYSAVQLSLSGCVPLMQYLNLPLFCLLP